MPGNPGEFYALSAQNLAGDEVVPMCDFRDDVVLVVNTASFCGNTPQYAPLEAMYEKYAAQGFYILGFPCNQFGEQEPGDAAQISAFCTDEYHITFPMFAKIDVNAPNEDPIYTWLKAQPGGAGDVDWNFAKFLIGRDGKFIKRWIASTQPTDPDVVSNVEAALAVAK
ncbi:MAG: glutathione peroxidase [Polyangiaceae bacterium]